MGPAAPSCWSVQVTVFDWATARVVSRGVGYKGTPPQVYGVEWDPHLDTGEERFITFGASHLKAWRQTVVKGQIVFQPHACAWNGAEPRPVLSAQFLPPGLEDSVDALVASSGTRQGKVGRGGARGRAKDDAGMIVTGHPLGEVLFWRDYVAVSKLQTHAPPSGVSARAAGAVEAPHGIRCVLCGRDDGRRSLGHALA